MRIEKTIFLFIALGFFGLISNNDREIKIEEFEATNNIISDETFFVEGDDEVGVVLKEKIAVNPNYVFNNQNKKMYCLGQCFLRKGPFNNSEAVKELGLCEEVFVCGYNDFNNFYKTIIDGNIYYISGDDITENVGDVFLPLECSVYAKEGAGIYTELSGQGKINIDINTEIKVVAQNDNYYKISSPYSGYIVKTEVSDKPLYNIFTRYELSDEQYLHLARVAYNEQGSLKGAAAEASLMCNLFENCYSSYGDVYNFVRNSGWFSCSKDVMDYGSCPDEIVKIVTAVIREGKRTVPRYVDDHDCFNDIISARNNGEEISIRDRSAYISGVTIISNRYTGTWTFWGFPTENSDPFGYKSEERKREFGDACYDFNQLKEELGL